MADLTFSPLALTQALPFLPLAQGTVDYLTERRNEDGLIDTLLDDPSTAVVVVRDGLLAVPRGQGELTGYSAGRMRLATLPARYVKGELSRCPGAVAVFLGADRGAGHATYYLAVDITRAVSKVPDDAGVAADQGFDHGVASDAPDSLFARIAGRFDWVDLRGFVPHASARESGLATSAVAISTWHNRQRHCPCCGAPVRSALAGWAQRCTGSDDGNRLLFPRVEPAVITAIVDSDDRILLQHNSAWNGNLYSVSAGFVEAGENLEHAVRREAMEEVGITVGEVRYLGSQPWPFPASLMMAFKGQALTTDVRVDHDETADARWMSRDEFTDAMVSGDIDVPGKATIARYMIEEWYGRPLQ